MVYVVTSRKINMWEGEFLSPVKECSDYFYDTMLPLRAGCFGNTKICNKKGPYTKKGKLKPKNDVHSYVVHPILPTPLKWRWGGRGGGPFILTNRKQ